MEIYDFKSEEEFVTYVNKYEEKTKQIDDHEILKGKINHYWRIDGISVDREEKFVIKYKLAILQDRLIDVLNSKK